VGADTCPCRIRRARRTLKIPTETDAIHETLRAVRLGEQLVNDLEAARGRIQRGVTGESVGVETVFVGFRPDGGLDPDFGQQKMTRALLPSSAAGSAPFALP